MVGRMSVTSMRTRLWSGSTGIISRLACSWAWSSRPWFVALDGGDWGMPIAQLPAITWDEFPAQSAKPDGRALVAIAGVVYDVAGFIKEHPGGRAFISSAIGKNATATFNGGIYRHSNAAHNLLSSMRVGVIYGGGEVQIWKQAYVDKQSGIKSRQTTHSPPEDGVNEVYMGILGCSNEPNRPV